MNKRAFSAYVSFALKIVGAIVSVSSIIDYIIFALPFQPLNPDWQIAFTSQSVDRGIVPMVGIAFLIAGYWLQEYRMGKTQPGKTRRISWGDLHLWTLIFSSVMGLIFFLLVPMHLSNLSLVRSKAIVQIEGRFSVEERRIQTQADQFRQLIEERERLGSPFWDGQVSGSRLGQLEHIRQQVEQWIENPEIFEQQYDEAMTQLGDRRQEAENQAKTNVLKSSFRIGVNSLLLAIGYTIIGWTGLRGLTGGGALPLSRQVRAR